MKILSVVGARPNFMKIAPLIRAIAAHNRRRAEDGLHRADGGPANHGPQSSPTGVPSDRHLEPIEHVLVHTGQHYDDRMSRAFFEALSIPAADINLGIGSGTHAEQVGRTMIAFEKVVREQRPDWVVVLGDVNATCACSITAKKEHVKLAHIEAGLRSRDMDMPEEINRLVTDCLSDLLLTPDELSSANLRAEGVAEERIRFVGNIMIDTLEANRAKAAALDIDAVIAANLLDGPSGSGVSPDREPVERPVPDASREAAPRPAMPPRYAVMTMHRPSNVDDPAILAPIIEFLRTEVAAEVPLLWPVHPRARKQLEASGLWKGVCATPNWVLLHPLGYHEMLRLGLGASIMLTDSGGLQEECCVLGTPCLTLRFNTERPVTLREHGGSSVLVGNAIGTIRAASQQALAEPRVPRRPALWDGHAAERIVQALVSY